MRIPALILAFGFTAFMLLGLDKKTEQVVTVGGVRLTVTVADSPDERTQGLSGKESLGEGEGMWFSFDTSGYHGIWMKDMHFPIDILWFDEDLKIVHIERGILPGTYPNVFRPPAPARYVLELPAGSSKLYDLAIGTIAEVK